MQFARSCTFSCIFIKVFLIVPFLKNNTVKVKILDNIIKMESRSPRIQWNSRHFEGRFDVNTFWKEVKLYYLNSSDKDQVDIR